jgi:hypothetical protein
MFAARYSPDGKLAWVVRAGGVDDDRAELVTTTLAGDVIVAGNVGRGATFGDAPHAITLAGPDKSEIANPDRVFVASYTADGQVRWAYQYGQRDLGRVIAVASLPDSSILIHGADEEIAGQGPRRVRSFLVQLDPGGRQLQDRTVEDATSFAFDGTLVSARRDASSLVFERHTVQRTASLAASLALPRQPFRVFALARGDDGRIALGAQAGEETQKELPNRRIETSYASVDVFIALAPTADQLPLRP